MLRQGNGASRLNYFIIYSVKNKVLDRRRLSELLKGKSLAPVLDYIEVLPPKKVISPLIKSFYQPEGLERWFAIRAFGKAVAKLADIDMEEARIVMRRLMWSLNDESGGIGWGAPEAMAEAMAQNERLASEYARILLSYVWEEGNFLEHLPLRRGALWGLWRLSETRPEIFQKIEAWRILKDYVNDKDPESKALAILALGHSNQKWLCDQIANNLSDRRKLELFTGDAIEPVSVADAAAKALHNLSCKDH